MTADVPENEGVTENQAAEIIQSPEANAAEPFPAAEPVAEDGAVPAEEPATDAVQSEAEATPAPAAEAGNIGENSISEAKNSRILNQEEIDSLLGFRDIHIDSEADDLQSVFNSSMVSYERLPMLEVVFDRLVRMLSTSLRNLTQDNVDVSLDEVVSLRFGDYLNSIPLPAMLAVFKAEEWDNYGLITIDSSLIYSTVDVLLGGRRGTAAMRIEGRPYTTIERNLVERMIHVILADLSAAFDPLSQISFHFDRLETNPRLATISRHSNAVILARFRIDMEDRGGRLELVIPYATLEPIRELLLQMFMGEKFGRDTIWETHLAQELWMTEVDLSAVLEKKVLSLKDVLQWKVGSQLLLDATADSDIELLCGDIPMFYGRMGRKGQNIAVQIEDKVKG